MFRKMFGRKPREDSSTQQWNEPTNDSRQPDRVRSKKGSNPPTGPLSGGPSGGPSMRAGQGRQAYQAYSESVPDDDRDSRFDGAGFQDEVQDEENNRAAEVEDGIQEEDVDLNDMSLPPTVEVPPIPRPRNKKDALLNLHEHLSNLHACASALYEIFNQDLDYVEENDIELKKDQLPSVTREHFVTILTTLDEALKNLKGWGNPSKVYTTFQSMSIEVASYFEETRSFRTIVDDLREANNVPRLGSDFGPADDSDLDAPTTEPVTKRTLMDKKDVLASISAFATQAIPRRGDPPQSQRGLPLGTPSAGYGQANPQMPNYDQNQEEYYGDHGDEEYSQPQPSARDEPFEPPVGRPQGEMSQPMGRKPPRDLAEPLPLSQRDAPISGDKSGVPSGRKGEGPGPRVPSGVNGAMQNSQRGGRETTSPPKSPVRRAFGPPGPGELKKGEIKKGGHGKHDQGKGPGMDTKGTKAVDLSPKINSAGRGAALNGIREGHRPNMLDPRGSMGRGQGHSQGQSHGQSQGQGRGYGPPSPRSDKFELPVKGPPGSGPGQRQGGPLLVGKQRR